MARADFALTDENEAAVVEICERLDHLPLAIELAAARVRGMSPADIAHRLDQRLQLLASSGRGTPGRHRTLDAAVRWSYDLLDETQQQVFDRLSVFAGPFTIDAAEAVVAGDGVEDWEVLDAILALVDKSLVLADDTTRATRYRVLETMRQFGSTNLATAEIEQTYRTRHTDHYAEFVLARRAQLHGAGDHAALDEITPEFENIRLALRNAAEDIDSARFENVFACLFPLWLGRGRTLEGLAWCGELRDRPVIDPRASIVALGFGAAIANGSDLDLALEMVTAAEVLSQSTSAAMPLQAIAVRSIVALMQGRSDDAIADAEQLIALAPDEPDIFVRLQSFQTVLASFAITGDLDRFAELRRDIDPAVEHLGSQFLIASHAASLSPVVHLVDPDHAEAVLLRGYALNDEFGNLQANCSHAMFLALYYLRIGNKGAAATWARRSLQLAIDHAPAYIAQVINTAIAVIKYTSPTDAAVLLGALRSHRSRRAQTGTQPEIDAEARYEASLRRSLGDEFETLFAQGAALDEVGMVALAFEQLDVVADSPPNRA